jgi:hypothetical protein
LRRFAFLLSLAFALATGQQIGLVHGLGHAAERIAQKQDPKPLSPACDQCGLCAQLDGPASVGLPDLGAAEGRFEAPAFHRRGDGLPTRVVFLARAPPVLS